MTITDMVWSGPTQPSNALQLETASTVGLMVLFAPNVIAARTRQRIGMEKPLWHVVRSPSGRTAQFVLWDPLAMRAKILLPIGRVKPQRHVEASPAGDPGQPVALEQPAIPAALEIRMQIVPGTSLAFASAGEVLVWAGHW